MKKTKYLVKQLGFVPPPFGGVSVYLKRLISKLNDDGFTSGGYYLDGNMDATIINSPLFDKFNWLNTRKLISRLWLFKNETKNYKIIHSHFSLEGMIFLWFLKVFFRKEIVITVHNSMIDVFYLSTNRINRFFLKLLIKENITWIAVSEKVKQKMQDLHLNFGTIHVIPAYIPSSNLENLENYLSESLTNFIKGFKKIIVFYGHSFMFHNAIDVYGFFDTLYMFKKLVSSNINLKETIGMVFCVTNNDNLKIFDSLKKYAYQEELKNIFWQVGPIYEMSALWQLADIYIRPTSTDGDSVAIREALDFGVKVVASNCVPRPSGVIEFELHNLDDFTKKVNEALNLNKKNNIVKNMCYYNEILLIYKELNNK